MMEGREGVSGWRLDPFPRPPCSSYTLVSTGNKIERTTHREIADVRASPSLKSLPPYLSSLPLHLPSVSQTD